MELNPNLIPLGFTSHLIHKSDQVAGEGSSMDVESIAMKITSFFSGERSGMHQRHQKFAEFCDFLDGQYRKFPYHGQTRSLTLCPLIERILQLWEPLKSHFLSIIYVQEFWNYFLNQIFVNATSFSNTVLLNYSTLQI